MLTIHTGNLIGIKVDGIGVLTTRTTVGVKMANYNRTYQREQRLIILSTIAAFVAKAKVNTSYVTILVNPTFDYFNIL